MHILVFDMYLGSEVVGVGGNGSGKGTGVPLDKKGMSEVDKNVDIHWHVRDVGIVRGRQESCSF